MKPIADSYLLVAFVVIALIVLLSAVGPRGGQVGLRRRLVLSLLRLGVIALLLFIMLRPYRIDTHKEQQETNVAVLIDRSRSMQTIDESVEKSRWEMVQQSIADCEPILERLAKKKMKIEWYTFAGDPTPVPAKVVKGKVQLPEKPTGEETAIGAALDWVARPPKDSNKSRRLLGVILLSDGAQRVLPPKKNAAPKESSPKDMTPLAAAESLRFSDYPLYTITYGKSRIADAVSIAGLLVPETVFIKHKLPITITIRAQGMAGKKALVKLFHGVDEEHLDKVEEQMVDMPTGLATQTVDFTLTPNTPGLHYIRVEIPRQNGEHKTDNNKMSAEFTVLDGGIKALYIEGTPRPEARYLRKSLGLSPSIELDYLRFDKNSRPGDLLERFQPDRYDVYILGDIDSTLFTKEELDRLAATIEDGAGLLMLGGMQSFGPGGYDKTALDVVLPIIMDPLKRQRPGDSLRGDLHVNKPLLMLPTAHSAGRSPMLLGPDQAASLEMWKELPPLTGANILKPKVSGVTLAQADGIPLLIEHYPGKGIAAALAVDTTWRWWIRGKQKTHKLFWRQLVTYLSQIRTTRTTSAWVRTESSVYSPGQSVRVIVGVDSPTADSGSDVQIKARIFPFGNKAIEGKPIQMRRGEKYFEGTISNLPSPGKYTVQVTAIADGKEYTARTNLTVMVDDLELDNPAADPIKMQEIAEETEGGKVVLGGDLKKLLEELAEKTENFQIVTENEFSYWDKGWVLLLIVFLLAIEWYLRKIWGMV